VDSIVKILVPLKLAKIVSIIQRSLGLLMLDLIVVDSFFETPIRIKSTEQERNESTAHEADKNIIQNHMY
jgi:hypothetical protein